MKQSHIREREETSCLIDFECLLIFKKRTKKLKTRDREASYKLERKLFLIRRNIQHFAGTVIE